MYRNVAHIVHVERAVQAPLDEVVRVVHVDGAERVAAERRVADRADQQSHRKRRDRVAPVAPEVRERHRQVRHDRRGHRERRHPVDVRIEAPLRRVPGVDVVELDGDGQLGDRVLYDLQLVLVHLLVHITSACTFIFRSTLPIVERRRQTDCAN